MGMTVEIEVGEIGNRLACTIRRYFAHPREAPETLSHLDVHQVRRMQLVRASKEASFNPGAQ